MSATDFEGDRYVYLWIGSTDGRNCRDGSKMSEESGGHFIRDFVKLSNMTCPDEVSAESLVTKVA